MSAPAPWIVLCAGACAALLACEYGRWRPGVWGFKMLASTAFVATAVAGGGLRSDYGRLVIAGLVLCWLGDLLLLPRRSQRAFLAGIGSFGLGHVAYGIAFLQRGVDAAALAWAAAGAALLGAFVLRWLWPRLTEVFVVAVPLYVGIIGCMLATAVATTAAGGPAAIAVGAALFAVSDLSVARDRLVAPGFANAAWGLPLYFAGQIGIAASVASRA